jgi:arginyl-tRNA synthetase
MTSSSTSSSMMTTTTLVNGDILRKHVASVVGSLLPPSSSDDASSSSMISPATKSEFGDYQINAAMSLFNRVKREKPKGDVGGEGTAEEVKGYASPREFAMGIIDELNPLLDGIATLEVAGPGFVNLRLTDEYLKMALGIMCRDAEVEGGRLGVPVAW